MDRWSLAALCMLIGFGVVMSLAASPPVAERIGYDGLHFVRRHLAMLPLAVGIMFVVSLQPPRTIRRIAWIGFGISLALLALTFLIGAEIKGARRWINLPGLSLQPSEFVKPTFAVVAAWLFSEQKLRPGFPGNLICAALFLAIIAHADQAAGHRHGSGSRCRLVRPVLHGRAAALLGGGGSARRALAGWSAPTPTCRMSGAG